MKVLYLPFIVQGVLMLVDETFHWKRGLGLWERLGHPLDSLTVFVPMSFIAFNVYTSANERMFLIMGLFSCLFITKDEWIHRQECSVQEQWLHSLLFVLHPIIFFSAWLLWKTEPEGPFLALQPVIVGVFMLYQIFKWSFTWKEAAK